VREISHHDLVVIGGGPAGLATAATAATYGLQVAIIDERVTLGGQIFKRLGEGFDIDSPEVMGKDYARGAALISEIDHPNITKFLATTVVTIDEGRIITSHPQEGVRSFTCDSLVIAPGAYDRPVAFPGWTLPGVMTAGAVQTLVKTQQISPGRRILFAGSGPLALAFSAQLIKYGAPVVKVLESAPFPSPLNLFRLATRVNGNWDLAADALRYRWTLLKERVPFLYNRIVVRAEGDGRLEAVTYSRVDKDWNPIPGSEEVESCDALCVGYGFFPSHELFRLLNCQFDYDENKGGFAVRKDSWGRTSSTAPMEIYSVGDGTGVTGSYSAVAQGRLAALAIAHASGKINLAQRDSAAGVFQRELSARNRFQSALNKMFSVGRGIYRLADGETVICRCENVKAKDLSPVIDSTSDVSVVKSYSRAGMGLCQARNCQRHIAAMIAERHGIAIDSINFQTPRWPVKPISIGQIADPSIREEKYFIQ
jgi:NADPH-dependent 2,4-dienoyl-CoA reductase/sulfur reductase-like enzyme